MTFLNEKPIKAVRKRHICQACDKFIQPGEAATNWCGINDGQFDSVYYHPDCREAEVAFNRLHDWGWMDDWMALSEREPEDNPWLKAEWPIPYLRLCMTREQWAAQGMSAGTAETGTGSGLQPASPVPQGCATQDTPNPEPSHV